MWESVCFNKRQQTDVYRAKPKEEIPTPQDSLIILCLSEKQSLLFIGASERNTMLLRPFLVHIAQISLGNYVIITELCIQTIYKINCCVYMKR